MKNLKDIQKLVSNNIFLAGTMKNGLNHYWVHLNEIGFKDKLGDPDVYAQAETEERAIIDISEFLYSSDNLNKQMEDKQNG